MQPPPTERSEFPPGQTNEGNASLRRARDLLREGEAILSGDSTPSESGVAQATSKFESALDAAGDDPAVSLAANLMLAQVLGEQALDVDTPALERAAGHARAAVEAGKMIERPEPAYSAACAAFGTLRLRVADRLPPLERQRALDESLEALRDAVGHTTDADPKRALRMANLAAALQSPLPGKDGVDGVDRMNEASEIYRELIDGPRRESRVAGVVAAAAHLEQRKASLSRSLGDLGAAADSFGRAEAFYADALDLAQGRDEPVGGMLMGLARLKFEAAEYDGDDQLLDESIQLGESAVASLQQDLGFVREATMQLAEQHVARLRRHHRPSDAAWADQLSATALNSWYHEEGSTELVGARNRRLNVLCSVALSPVGTDEHFIEVDDLLRALYTNEARSPQMEAISAMAEIARLFDSSGYAAEPDVYAALIQVAERFESVLTDNDFVAEDPAWWIRWFSAHRRVATWAEWVGIDDSVWLPPLAEAADRMQSRMSQIPAHVEAFALGRLQLGEVVMVSGVLLRDEAELQRARELLETTRTAAGLLSPSHRIKAGAAGAHLCDLLGDAAGATSWIEWARSALADLERSGRAPLAARLAVDRERYELAGTAAVIANEPEELAWSMHSVAQSTPDGHRAAFLEDLAEVSEAVTVVFVAQGRRRCRAAVLGDGQWQTVELPALALDRIGEVIRSAHRAHAEAQTGDASGRTRWDDARRALNAALSPGLAPLAAVLSDDTRPVALRLSGWLHAVPVAPALLWATGHRRSIAVSFGSEPSSTGAPLRRRELVALAAPGDGIHQGHLPNAVEDVELVAAMFDRGEVVVDATVTDVTSALLEAKVILIASHGVAAEQPEMARLILHDGDLTAADIVDMNLRGVELAVVAACEALATDRLAPGHPFNVQTAIIRAGAQMACGPQWAIADDIASLFTRTLFASMAGGDSLAESYRVASWTVVQSSEHFRDLTLFVDTERTLSDR